MNSPLQFRRPARPAAATRASAGCFAAILLLLAGCASSPLSRIDQDRAKYESWPLDVQEAVLAGEARKGMTKEQVEMALGKPTQVIPGGRDEEVWIYQKGGGVSNPLRGSGIVFGTGGAGVSVGGGGTRGVTPDEYQVVFRNDVVIRSDTKS